MALLSATDDHAVGLARDRYRSLARTLLAALNADEQLFVLESGQLARSEFSRAAFAEHGRPFAKAEAIVRNQYFRHLTQEYEIGDRVWKWPPSAQVGDDFVHLQVVLAQQIERRRELLWMLDVGPHSVVEFVFPHLTMFVSSLLRGASRKDLEDGGFSRDEVRQYSEFLDLPIDP